VRPIMNFFPYERPALPS